MKKASIVTAWLLTACLLLSMAACSGAGNVTTTPTATTTTTTTTNGAADSTTVADKTTTTTQKVTTTTKDGETTVTDKPTTTTKKPTTTTTAKVTTVKKPVTTTTKKVSTTTTKKPMVTTTTKKPTTEKVTTTTKKSTTTENATTTTVKPTTTTTVKVEEPHITFRDTSENGGSIGSWWWSKSQATNVTTREEYLEFLHSNQVTEVYLHASGMTDAQITAFIRSAAVRGIRVAWLMGDASWIKNNYTDCVTTYLAYQQTAPEDAKFYALHLDVEPHQLSSFSEDRAGVMQLYADYVQEVGKLLHAAGEKVEWDIPFWLESDVVTIDGNEIPLLEAIASASDTLCLMSYRDKASSILSVSKEEIEVAKKYGCKVICGVETSSSEGDFVSFMEEGKAEMYAQLETVYTELGKKGLTAYGVAIHHVPKWKDLKN